ncbi:MAG: putative Ig domain-containing protein [Chloroflexi bacterium]|nr:putative Ig domain-containing protein [Chloroflexota bacterium]
MKRLDTLAWLACPFVLLSHLWLPFMPAEAVGNHTRPVPPIETPAATSLVMRHRSSVMRHPSPDMRHASSVTHHSSPVTRHPSHLTPSGTPTGTAAPTAPSLIPHPSSLIPPTATVLPPLRITTDSLPAGVVGRPYSLTLTAAGGAPPLVWSHITPDPIVCIALVGVICGQIPTGLTLRPDGVILGTPSAVGQYLFTITVTDTAQASAEKGASIVVAGWPLTTTELGLRSYLPLTLKQGPHAGGW